MLSSRGFGCDQTMWRSLAPAFAQRFRTISFDLVGSGESDRNAYDRDYVGGFNREELDEPMALMDDRFDDWANYLAPAILGAPTAPNWAATWRAASAATTPPSPAISRASASCPTTAPTWASRACRPCSCNAATT